MHEPHLSLRMGHRWCRMRSPFHSVLGARHVLGPGLCLGLAHRLGLDGRVRVRGRGKARW